MIILGIMQNQWFRDPAAVKAMLDRYPGKRHIFIKRLLFAGCLSGRRLRATFGDLCDKIIWEEASPLMANHSSGALQADIDHIRNVIETHKPETIICFGKIAGEAVRSMALPIKTLYAPHPAARGENIVPELVRIADELMMINEGAFKKQKGEHPSAVKTQKNKR